MRQSSVLASIGIALGLVIAGAVAHADTANDIALYNQFNAHTFDPMILKSLGFGSGSVVYLSELGSINQAQLTERNTYEPLGCYPFNLMQNGQVVETGYNCQTFFCVGYLKGPKICEDRSGNPYGGVVEINRRLSLPYVNTVQKTFTSFDASQQTPAMKQKIQDLSAVKCSPFYLMLFDVAVGEGYTCDEVGQYPYFSAKNTCLNDWRKTDGLVCIVPQRDNEFDIRKTALAYRGGVSFASESSASSEIKSSVSSASSASSITASYPDVIEGHYGYTAIMDLTARGIVAGYSDGTFHPYDNVNRAEFAKFFMSALHQYSVSSDADCFPDVGDTWYSPYVCAAHTLGWVQGYPDGTFGPDKTINKAEAMKIIITSASVPLDSVATLPTGTPDGQWYTPYIRKAMDLHMILESSFDPSANVTRADVSVWMYRLLKALGK